MKFKNFLIIFSVFLFFSGCQTIKEKTDLVVEKENQKFGLFVGKKVNELKMELGTPTEDYINETGNKVLVYKTTKYTVLCERKFEVSDTNTVIKYSSNGCI